jgi:hypothetical protein
MQWILPGGAILGGGIREYNEHTVVCRPLATVQERLFMRHARKVKGEGGRVRSGRFEVQYSTDKNEQIKGPHVCLTNYRQQDGSSCGFVAALTVVRHFKPDTPARDVLLAVRPEPDWGVNRVNLTASLETLGVHVGYRNDLTIDTLKAYVNKGIPVIVSVWPDEWINDHWVVVRGFDDERVYLTNYKSSPLSIDDFKKEWSDMDMRCERGNSGEGLVCRRKAAPSAPTHAVSRAV